MGEVRDCAVLLPGRAYDVGAPLPGAVAPEVAEEHVVRHLRQATVDVPTEATVLVVAKSLGTRAASYAASRSWCAAWMTPLLTDPSCRAGIAANRAPQLLVGGTADPYWDPAVAAVLGRAATVEVLEVAGADHGLVLGDDGATAVALDRAGQALGAFARGLRGSS